MEPRKGKLSPFKDSGFRDFNVHCWLRVLECDFSLFANAKNTHRNLSDEAEKFKVSLFDI